MIEQNISEEAKEIARLKEILAKQGYDISQTLGKALGYITDDPNSNVGEHIAETLADEAGRELVRLKEGLRLTQENHIKSIEERDRLNARISELEKERKTVVEMIQDAERYAHIDVSDADCELWRIFADFLGRARELWEEKLKKANDEKEQLTARITNLERERDELRAWKESILKVESSWDVQAVGKLIEASLGEAIQPCIEPYIRKLRADLEAKEELLQAFRDESQAINAVLSDAMEKLSRAGIPIFEDHGKGDCPRTLDAQIENALTKLTDSEARCESLEEAVNYSIKALVRFNSGVFYASGEPIGEPFDPAPNYIHVYWKLASAQKPGFVVMGIEPYIQHSDKSAGEAL